MKIYYENRSKCVTWIEYPTTFSKYAYTRKHTIKFNNKFNYIITDLVGFIMKDKNNQKKIIKYIEKSITLSKVFKDELIKVKRITKINKIYNDRI